MRNHSNSYELPLVSVIIPCFNCEAYISRCIESILSQDYNNIEIIVIDDGSTDNSISIIQSYKDVDLYTQKNSGACIARNSGLSKCKGKYVKFLDADDFLEPYVIKKQVDLSEKLENNRIIYGDYFLYKDGEKIYKSTYLKEECQTVSLILGDILTSTPLHKRWMLNKVKGFDERFRNSQEWNLHVRLSSEGFIFHHQNIPIYNYRIHHSPNRISAQRQCDANRQIYEAVKLEMTYEKLANNYRGDIAAAFSAKYFLIARNLYQLGDIENAFKYLKKSQLLTTQYLKFISSKYKFAYKLLGFENTERLIKVKNSIIDLYNNLIFK